MNSSLIQSIKAARAVGTPLLAITTTDQVAVITTVKAALNGHPALLWDRARGIVAINDEGGEALSGKDEALAGTADPTSAMIFALTLPKGSVVYAMNMGTALKDEPSLPLIQAISNLRDNFKASMRTLIMFDHQFTLPGALRHDVTVLDDPLPSDDEYGVIVKKVNQLAKFPEANKKLITDASVAVRGLSAFEAEQALAMAVALNPKKLDLRHVWDLKVAAINQVPGLTMTLDGPPLDTLKGMDALVKTMRRFAEGPLAPLVYVRVDEIEKAMAGLGANGGPGDNTGITQDFLSQFLTQMEDNGWTGFIFAGVRGGGKTVLTKSIGAEYGVPTISMDIGGMKASHVGESEGRIRAAFKSISSVGRNRVCVLATSNDISVLPPEFLRRFKFGIYYFDLLGKSERAALWPIYMKEFNLSDQPTPNDEGWTGAEIRNCCEIAYGLKETLIEAAEKVVPVTKSDPVSVNRLRHFANGNWLSAAKPGVYKYDGPPETLVGQVVQIGGQRAEFNTKES